MGRETATDTDLLRRARHDAEAFGEFYERHARRIYARLVRDTGDADLAADLTAETFAEALRAVHGFRGVHAASGAAWISAIALNVLRQPGVDPARVALVELPERLCVVARPTQQVGIGVGLASHSAPPTS